MEEVWEIWNSGYTDSCFASRTTTVDGRQVVRTFNIERVELERIGHLAHLPRDARLKHLAVAHWLSEDEHDAKYPANRHSGIQAVQQAEARERLNQKKAAKQAAIQEQQERDAFYVDNPRYGAF